MMSAVFQPAVAETVDPNDPCRSDATKFCSEHMNDLDSMVACLTKHKAQLNPGCKKLFGG
jgi:hypothetical protein